MGKKIKPRSTSSYDRKPKQLENKFPIRELLIVFSFRDLDRNQGQGFKEWEENEILAAACEKLAGISQLTVGQAVQQQIVKVYTKVSFPPESNFVHPIHVSDDVNWASMHIQGKECIIGYFEENVFYIVFLDMNHEFWITKKKHT